MPPQLRVIQGDGANYEANIQLYEALKTKGISAENLVLGMGGALLQKVDRDTQKFALKCSSAIINGKEIDVEKSPVEMDASGKLSPSFKKSKAGRLKLIKVDNEFKTVKQGAYPELNDELLIVFENGQLINEWNFEDIRLNVVQETVL